MKEIGGIKENANVKKGTEENTVSEALRQSGSSTRRQSIKVTGCQPASLAPVFGRDLAAESSTLTCARFLGVKEDLQSAPLVGSAGS